MTWLRTRPEAGGVIAPSNLAKLKTGVEMAAIAGLMMPYALIPAGVEQLEGSNPLAWAGAAALVLLLWAAAALSLYTAAQYVRAVRAA
jgi:cardiolipin synthase (CMP-forming)